MSEFEPIKTVSDLFHLDEQEVLDGYLCGLHENPEPGSDKSRSFWHGWRNSQVDMGFMPSDAAQPQLAEEFLRKQQARINMIYCEETAQSSDLH